MKTNQFELKDIFDIKWDETFTHDDYLIQLINNGQPTAFKEHLTKMSNKALVYFQFVKKPYSDYVKAEILIRMI
jgi:hypothetical protein